MGKKNHSKSMKKKLTKKEKKQQNHLRLIEGKKGKITEVQAQYDGQQKKAA